MITPVPDFLRLLIIPFFLWLAVLDIRTRRVPRWVWWPLGTMGMIALGWAAVGALGTGGFVLRYWLIQVTISVGLIAPMGYVFHRLGAFGAADAKAVVVLAIAFPTYPVIAISGHVFPLIESPLGVFSLTILVNAVLLGLVYPVGLAFRNGLHGRFEPTMFFGKPVHWRSLERRHGTLLEDPAGFSRHGLDLDALRMYLRWRDADLAELRADPDIHSEPSSVPKTTNTPGDGRVRTDGGDRWAARAFLEEVDGAYGTRPEDLRGGLDVICERECIWISPGIPFLVLLVAGLLVGLIVGDLFTGIVARLGM